MDQTGAMTSQKLLLSYYGDDLTGSTDVMEALALGGVPTVLFTRVPDAGLLARFGHCRAIGIAGTSRSETPEWMNEHLTPVFKWLRSLGSAITHYKVCSTFDSSPQIGSIGRALEIGRSVFDQACVPLIVGAPQLKRYTAFGNLFANYRGENYRIDRHPVMSRHPVTPMDEANLLKHLSRQTSMRPALVDLVALRAPDATGHVDAALSDSDFVLLDVADRETQHAAGAQLWRVAREQGGFVVGSSGVEYALLMHWRTEAIAVGEPAFADPGPVDRLAVVSGSVSPTTASQIDHATRNGFDAIPLDPVALSSAGASAEIETAITKGLAVLAAGRSVILYTALGPKGDRGAEIGRTEGARQRLGQALGDILARLVAEQGLTRAVIAGGDTSSHALGRLGTDALTVCMPLPQSPGSPLCTAHSSDASIEGLQIALKGGQVGNDSYFSSIREGRAN